GVLMPAAAEGVVAAQPDAVVAATKAWNVQEITALDESNDGFREVEDRLVVLLEADAEGIRPLGIIDDGNAGAIAEKSQSGVSDERVTEKLRRFVIGRGVAVEVVGQVQTSGANGQALAEQLSADPRFAQVDCVLRREAGRVAVEQGQTIDFLVR